MYNSPGLHPTLTLTLHRTLTRCRKERSKDSSEAQNRVPGTTHRGVPLQDSSLPPLCLLARVDGLLGLFLAATIRKETSQRHYFIQEPLHGANMATGSERTVPFVYRTPNIHINI